MENTALYSVIAGLIITVVTLVIKLKKAATPEEVAEAIKTEGTELVNDVAKLADEVKNRKDANAQ